jgi:hypothetical protein
MAGARAPGATKPQGVRDQVSTKLGDCISFGIGHNGLLGVTTFLLLRYPMIRNGHFNTVPPPSMGWYWSLGRPGHL